MNPVWSTSKLLSNKIVIQKSFNILFHNLIDCHIATYPKLKKLYPKVELRHAS